MTLARGSFRVITLSGACFSILLRLGFKAQEGPSSSRPEEDEEVLAKRTVDQVDSATALIARKPSGEEAT